MHLGDAVDASDEEVDVARVVGRDVADDAAPVFGRHGVELVDGTIGVAPKD